MTYFGEGGQDDGHQEARQVAGEVNEPKGGAGPGMVL
jgi:hypothetical protein